jgi:hypothetical protein
MAVLLLVQVRAAAQAQAGPAAATTAATKAPAGKGTLPRTGDGKPDLSGLWNDRTGTPLQRDRRLGAKEFYTDQEFADLSTRIRRGENISAGPRANAAETAPADAAPANAEGGAAGRAVVQEDIYDNTIYGDVRKDDPLVSTKRTSLIVGPEGRIPPMLPVAVKRNAAIAAALKGHELDSYEYRNLEERCILSNLEKIPILPNRDANTHLQIVQGSGWVIIYQELNHDTRLIPTDGRPHIAQNVRQLQGDSVGHWEGDTLVVDTTNFTNRSAWQGSSENLHLVERFTLTAPETLLYRFTVEDPSTWATPWTVEIPWTRKNELLYEYACHEGNDAIRLVLGGARAQEAEAAKSAK